MEACLIWFNPTGELFYDFGRVTRSLRLKIITLGLALTENNDLYGSVLLLAKTDTGQI